MKYLYSLLVHVIIIVVIIVIFRLFEVGFCLNVSRFTTVNFVNLSLDSTIRQTISAFLNHRVDIGCVTEGTKLLGIIHKNAIYRALLKNIPLNSPIRPLINKNVVTIQKDQSLYEARDIMIKGNVSEAVVLDQNDQVYGIMSKLDLVNSNMTVLEDTLNRMKSLVENLQDAVISVDSNLKILTFNQTALDLLKLNGKSLLNSPIDRFLPDFRRWLIETLKTGEIQNAKRINFEDLSVIASFIPIREINMITGAMVVLRDVTSYEIIANELETTNRLTDPFAHVISENPQMKKFKQEAVIAAKSLSNVLLTGESGTGKELFAEGIHSISGCKGSFIKINCAAIPEELLESEFFGYADGAFTGAKKGGKPGKFELAHNGTLFLDEIGDMPLSLQVKLLRVLQEQEFERIGATKTTKVNVRIIAATNKDLAELVKQGKLREDLFYRIHVIHLHIPPLRERLDDIPLLCNHFMKKITIKTNKKLVGVSPEVIKSFQDFHWPGNIRQLENTLERAFHFSQSNWIEMEHLPGEMNMLYKSPFPSLSQKTESDVTINRKQSMSQTEKEIIVQALRKCQGNRTKAAEMLGVSRTTLYHKIKKYQIIEELAYRIPSS